MNPDFIRHSSIKVRAQLYTRELKGRIKTFAKTQQELGRQLKVKEYEHSAYTEDLRSRIHMLKTENPTSRILLTSGTRATPKEIWYPHERIQALRRECILQSLLAYHEVGLEEPRLYFLTGLTRDESLSDAVFTGGQDSGFMKYILRHSMFERSVSVEKNDKQHWFHLAMLVAFQPSLLVTVNPSSLLVLLNQCLATWSLAELQRAFSLLHIPASLRDQAYKSLASLGNEKPQIDQLLSKLQAVMSWQGGYVGTYVEQLKSLLGDKVNFRHLMSLSTETVATVELPSELGAGAAPLFPGIVYEYLLENEDEERIVPASSLNVGDVGTLIVSDLYGLTRYNTEDLFECHGFVQNVPLLRFLRRRGIIHSFTGEKITGEQLEVAYAAVRADVEDPSLQLICFPFARHEGNPGYGFIIVSSEGNRFERDRCSYIASALDAQLSKLNAEYNSKRRTNRLAGPVAATVSLNTVMETILKHTRSKANLGQFKLLPLYSDIPFTLFLSGEKTQICDKT